MSNQFIAANLLGGLLVQRGYVESKHVIDGRKHRSYAKGGKIWITPFAYVEYPFVSQTLRTISKSKDLAYDYVARLGYNVPKTTQLAIGQTYADTIDAPLVVKPVDGSSSVGLTLNIVNEQQLLGAVSALHEAGKNALVQEQFSGQEIRMTLMYHKVESAILRAVPQLTGDGQHTIDELLTAENKARTELSLPYATYPQLTAEIVAIPTDSERVPVAGEVVILGDSTVRAGGASIYNVDNVLHESYRDIAVDFAEKLNADFLIVDMLVKDLSQVANSDNYVFLEFNTAPSLMLYYTIRNGNQFDIAPVLTDMIEASI